jgi:hypothetical protein
LNFYIEIKQEKREELPLFEGDFELKSPDDAGRDSYDVERTAAAISD